MHHGLNLEKVRKAISVRIYPVFFQDTPLFVYLIIINETHKKKKKFKLEQEVQEYSVMY